MPNLTMPTPIELAFEPINLCNARCFCCPYTYLEKDKEYRGKRMSEDQVRTLIHDFADGIKEHNIQNFRYILHILYSYICFAKNNRYIYFNVR